MMCGAMSFWKESLRVVQVSVERIYGGSLTLKHPNPNPNPNHPDPNPNPNWRFDGLETSKGIQAPTMLLLQTLVYEEQTRGH